MQCGMKDFYNKLLHTDIQKLEGEELEKLYKVPFLIWANYDIKEENVKRTSNNYLSTYLAEVAGIKKTGYLEYLTKLREEIPADRKNVIVSGHLIKGNTVKHI